METYQELKKYADIAEAIAEELSVPVCITIVDASGHPVLVRRMPGANVLALELAERKAYTSVVSGLETETVAELVLPGQPLYSLTSSSSKLVAFGGGTAVTFGSETFGVGVSGGTTEQDLKILHNARTAFGNGEWIADRSA